MKEVTEKSLRGGAFEGNSYTDKHEYNDCIVDFFGHKL